MEVTGTLTRLFTRVEFKVGDCVSVPPVYFGREFSMGIPSNITKIYGRVVYVSEAVRDEIKVRWDIDGLHEVLKTRVVELEPDTTPTQTIPREGIATEYARLVDTPLVDHTQYEEEIEAEDAVINMDVSILNETPVIDMDVSLLDETPRVKVAKSNGDSTPCSAPPSSLEPKRKEAKRCRRRRRVVAIPSDDDDDDDDSGHLLLQDALKVFLYCTV